MALGIALLLTALLAGCGGGSKSSTPPTGTGTLSGSAK